MTSSHADTSIDSLPMNHPKNEAEFADKRNVGNIDNEAVIEAQAHSESNSDNALAEASKDAQVPEATIKMETVAPDVVVASLETPENEDVDDSQPVDEFTNNHSDIEFTDTAEAFFQEKDKDKTEVNAASNKTISNQNHAKDTETQKLVVEKKRQEDTHHQ